MKTEMMTASRASTYARSYRKRHHLSPCGWTSLSMSPTPLEMSETSWSISSRFLWRAALARRASASAALASARSFACLAAISRAVSTAPSFPVRRRWWCMLLSIFWVSSSRPSNTSSSPSSSPSSAPSYLPSSSPSLAGGSFLWWPRCCAISMDFHSSSSSLISPMISSLTSFSSATFSTASAALSLASFTAFAVSAETDSSAMSLASSSRSSASLAAASARSAASAYAMLAAFFRASRASDSWSIMLSKWTFSFCSSYTMALMAKASSGSIWFAASRLALILSAEASWCATASAASSMSFSDTSSASSNLEMCPCCILSCSFSCASSRCRSECSRLIQANRSSPVISSGGRAKLFFSAAISMASRAT
mmetsp:Transcript_29141/g.77023  ORF Transcript_29141/g.77023 Transcript_29141/m.77023 type:complete len:368 (+) Transcript_29141:195-1298(+)